MKLQLHSLFALDKANASIRKLLETRKQLTGDCQIPLELCGEDEDNIVKAIVDFFNRMDAIASGIEAKVNQPVGYSQTVTARTVGIARQLGIPEEAIQWWAVVRLMCDFGKF